MYKAVVEEEIPIIGYIAWSFVDNNEWGSFKPRFGLHYVNYTTPELPRIPRPAAKWFAHLSTTKGLDNLNLETVQMGTNEEQEATATLEELHYPEAGGNGGVP
ncbi:Lactase-phlorizin hydrolase [Phytophthora citrophthora]|uniref:Lactase-phlorizin hydrolase n=1 Tax=Phytophthora citrophthora TaxID=4793 RepID=A0AAD9GLV1_9STRA|nr:Lactase-phlorizin hydrolase [Phytophthora citrophthora]